MCLFWGGPPERETEKWVCWFLFLGFPSKPTEKGSLKNKHTHTHRSSGVVRFEGWDVRQWPCGHGPLQPGPGGGEHSEQPKGDWGLMT